MERVIESPWIGRKPVNFSAPGAISAAPVTAYPPREAQPMVGATGGTEFIHPFKVSDASDGTAKVHVAFGLINDVTPEIGGTTIDTDPPPELSVSTGYVWLEITLFTEDDEEADPPHFAGQVDTAEIKSGTTLPLPTNTLGRIALASVTVSGGTVTAINQAVTHSLAHDRCYGPIHRFWAI